MTALLEKKLDFYIKNNLNVLFRGRHGIGKSSLILDAFKRNGIKFKYFSAATMDPWVDFVGVPKEKVGADGTSYIELLKPKDITDGSIEAFFFDEFNRAPKKVRNAVMEILQFKSINGTKLTNLRFVWGAINPKEDENLKFDVESLDPAQEDRFEIHIDLPFAIDNGYMVKKFGEDVAMIASDWWSKIPKDIVHLVSPRRLDYALHLHGLGGDIRDVLPHTCNPSKLVQSLKTAPIARKLKDLIESNNSEEAKEYLKNDNNYFAALDIIKEKKGYVEFFLPLFDKEKLASLIVKDKEIHSTVLASPNQFKDVLSEIYKSTSNKGLKYSIGAAIPDLVPKEEAKPTTSVSPIVSSGSSFLSEYMVSTTSTPKSSKLEELYTIKTLKSTVDEDNMLYSLDRYLRRSFLRNPSTKPAGSKRSYIYYINQYLIGTITQNKHKEYIAGVLKNLCLIISSSQIGTVLRPDTETDIGIAISRCLIVLGKRKEDFLEDLRKASIHDRDLANCYSKIFSVPALLDSIDLGKFKVIL